MDAQTFAHRRTAYKQRVASGALDAVEMIDDFELLLIEPDLIDDCEPFSRVFGMTTPAEQAFCQWYAAHAYTGWGEWVELGTFLGSLTFPTVRGLRANKRPAVQSRKIRVFDLFLWDHTMVNTAKYSGLTDYPKEGDWYIEYYKRYIDKIIDRVEVKQADLTRRGYPGGEIEFLILDVMKYPKLVRNILKEFFPSLRKGSRLFHQDYLHFYESWITLSMYQMRQYAKHVKTIDESYTVIFEMTDIPDSALLDFPLDSTQFELDYIREAFAWSRSIISPARHPEIYATECMMLFHAQQLDECKKHYRDHCRQFQEIGATIELKNYLAKSAGFTLE